MDKESIARATPLVERKLANQREKNKMGLVKAALASKNAPSTVTPDIISDLVDEEFGVSLDDGKTDINAGSILESLEREGVVSQNQDGAYEITETPETNSFNDLIDPVWEEFKLQLQKESNADVDLHYINNDLEEAFYAFCENYLGLIIESSAELAEFETDTIYLEDIESVIEETSESHAVRSDDLFKEQLSKYLEEPSDTLLDLINDFYMTAINIDLLSREKDLSFDEIPGSGKKLILDTNVLVALLCKTDNVHPLAKSVCERSSEIGFDLVYTSNTRDELNRFIHGSKREMDGFHSGDKEFEAIRSQFAHDYFQRDHITWSDYIAEVSDWPRLVDLQWGITELEETPETDSEVFEFARDSLRQLDKTQDEKLRESEKNKISHDANLLSITKSLRERERENVDLGPYLLTLHNKITTISEIGKENYWDDRISLQLRTWLNYLATFTPSDISDMRPKEVATAIIESSRSEEPEIDVSNYSRLIAPKAGLESREEDLLADYFINHPLSREMEKALERNRGDRAEELAKEMLEDEERLERFKKLKDQEERVETLQDSLSDLRQDWETEKKQREKLEKILENQSKIEVHVSASATASASVQNEVADLNEEINEFIELLDTRLSEGYEDSDLPSPPDDEASIEETEEWLKELKVSIASTAAVSALEPYAGDLVEAASSLI